MTRRNRRARQILDVYTLTYLSLGASNNGGNDGGNGTPSDWNALQNGQVVWNHDRTLNTNGTKWDRPRMNWGPFNNLGENSENPVVWAGDELLKAKWPTRNLQTICYTNPGDLASWRGSGQTSFDKVVAIHGAAGIGPMQYFSWIQGGTDAESETPNTGPWDTMVADYQDGFENDLLAGLISAGVLASDVKIVIAGLSLPDDAANAAVRAAFNEDCFIPLAASLPNCTYVSADDIPTQSSPTDNPHFTSAGYKTHGADIGQALAAL